MHDRVTWKLLKLPVFKDPEYSLGRLIAEAPILWPPDVKGRLIGKDPDVGKIEGRRRSGQQRMRWLDGIIDTMDAGLSKP